MKKLLALLLALMMLFSVATVFAGCEDNNKKKSSSSKNDDDEEEEDEDDEEEPSDKDGALSDKESSDGETTAPGKKTAAVSMGNLIGLSKEEAISEIESYDMNIVIVVENVYSDQPEGTVIAQSVEPNTDVAANTSITLEISQPFDHTQKLLGQWTYTLDVSDFMNAKLAESLGDVFTEPDSRIYAVISMNFDENDNLKLSMGREETSADTYLKELAHNLAEYLYAIAEEQGIDRETADARYEAEYSMSIEEYCLQNFNPDYHLIDEDGYYLIDEETGRIYVGEAKSELDDRDYYMIYEFHGDTLVIMDMYSNGEYAGESEDMDNYSFMALPWYMERQ